MSDIKFRRSLPNAPKSRRRPLTIILAITLIAVLALTLPRFLQPSRTIIDIRCLPQNQFIIQADTTHFDQFASVLLSQLRKAKQQTDSSQIEIQLHIPNSFAAQQITDILSLTQAAHPIIRLDTY